jgi:hypothetical protein
MEGQRFIKNLNVQDDRNLAGSIAKNHRLGTKRSDTRDVQIIHEKKEVRAGVNEREILSTSLGVSWRSKIAQ